MTNPAGPSPGPSPYPVVVVGAGLAGSAAAAFLSHGGVPPVVLERHSQPTARPRAWIISARTQELFRELGLADTVRTAGSPGTWNLQVVGSLQDVPAEQKVVDQTAEVSPAGAAMCDQDVIEDILREYATQFGAQVRWGQTVTGLVDKGDFAEVHRAGGAPIRARYVILAQGARADLLDQVGIGYDRPGAETAEFYQVLFRSAALDELMAARAGKAFFCQPSGTIVFRRDLGRWQIQRQGRDFGDLAADIAAAAGQPVDADILDHGRWRPTAQLAGAFRSGSIFVAGDAAHSMPPSLGMAGNLAVADAHNLAWKLVWVLSGRAGPGLLDSYEPERRPVGEFVLNQSLAAMRGKSTLDLVTVQLGLGYPPGLSPALLSPTPGGDGTGLPITDPHDLTPVVGARLPHRWLPDGRSSLDLASIDRFATVPAADDPGEVWIIRPDGHVGARVPDARADAAVATILGG